MEFIKNKSRLILKVSYLVFITIWIIFTFININIIRNVSVQTTVESVENTQTENYYILKRYGNKIGIYHNTEDTPFQILEVYVDNLPEYDRNELKTGIKIYTEQALSAIIEDFSN